MDGTDAADGADAMDGTDAADATDGADGTGPSEFVFAVTGTMAAEDEASAKAAHDQVAGGGEEPAKAAGDFGHDAMLATSLLGYEPAGIDFFGLDRWDNIEGALAFYSDPQVAEGFGALFSGPPEVTAYARTDWYGWGDLDSGDGGDHWFVVIRAELADEPSAIQEGHDQVAAGGEEPAKAAGDVAHVAFLGVEDPKQFMAIDIWTDDSQIEAFYSNPDFQAAFSTLFSGPPSIVVYHSTDWHQW